MFNFYFFLPFQRTKFKFLVLSDIQSIMSFYAVAKGRNPGIYSTWDECKAQVNKFSGPIYKKFKTKVEAENFIKERSGTSSTSTRTKTSSLLSTQKIYPLSKKHILQANGSSSKRLLSTNIDNDDDDDDDEDFKNILKKVKYNSNDIHDDKSKNEFIVDQDGYTEVFTDGACTSNGKGNAKAGVGVWFFDGCELNVSQPVVGRATNNMAEIQAVTIAARQAHKAGIKKLKISTDSKFLISCITQWMPKWKRCGWQTSTGKPVINKVELIEMEKALASLEVTWNHVRGHVGIYGNEVADRLARNGSERYRQT